MTRRIVVQKFGGSSVATTAKLKRVAELVVAKKSEGVGVVVVVSAQGDTTDELLAKAKEVSPEPDRRELDMLLTAGERISMALLAMAIRERGMEAVSLTGSQSGIITTASHSQARIVEVRPFRVEDELELGRIVIVAGYQGISYRREITTLGRGGSDTTAVALAAALGAEACEIYSDVDGVYTADPRVVGDAKKLGALGYEEMQELATAGARVLNPAAVEFAKQAGIAIYARKTGSIDPGTVIRTNVPSAASGVRGIAHEAPIGLVRARGATRMQLLDTLKALDALEVVAKQVSFADGAELSFVLSLDDVHHERKLRAELERILGPGVWRGDVGAVSLIGEGITNDARHLQKALEVAGDAVLAVSTSRYRITMVVPADRTKPLVADLHRIFDLASTEAQLS